MSVKNQIVALNRLISDIYQTDGMRIGFFLSKIGLNEKQIEKLRNGNMKELADGFTSIFKNRIFYGEERLFLLIAGRYGLEGNPPETLNRIGDAFGISRERARQLEKAALNRCGKKNEKAMLEKSLKALALGILSCGGTNGGENPESGPYGDGRERAFGFEIRDSGKNESEIRIAPLKADKGETGMTLKENQIEFFLSDLTETIKAAGWNKAIRHKKMDEIKQKYPRAYETWTERDETLKDGFQRGLKVGDLSALLERQPGAVASRLVRLGLK